MIHFVSSSDVIINYTSNTLRGMQRGEKQSDGPGHPRQGVLYEMCFTFFLTKRAVQNSVPLRIRFTRLSALLLLRTVA